jgi:hypothetical protein
LNAVPRLIAPKGDLESAFSSDGMSAFKFAGLLFAYLCLIVVATIVGGATGAYFMLAPLVAATLYFAASDPAKALICFLSFLSMEGMYRYVINFAPASYVLSPVIAGLMVMVFQSRGNLVFNRSNTLPYVGLYLFILFIGFLQIFNPRGSGIYDGLATYSFWYFCPMVMFPIIYYVKIKKDSFSFFIIALVMISAFVSLVATLQYLQGSAWTYHYFPGSEKTNKMGLFFNSKSVFRPMSMSTIHGGYGFWSAMGILPAFIIISLQKIKISIRVICLLAIVIDIYAILISGTRSALMIVIMQVVIYVVLKINSVASAIRVSLLLLVVFGVFRGVFALAETNSAGFVADRFEDVLSNPAESYNKNRGSNLGVLLPMIAENPLGKGYQRGTAVAGATTDTTNRETQFAALISDWGVIGMVLMMVLSILFLVKMYGIRRVKRSMRYSFIDMSIALMLAYIILYFVAAVLQANYFFWMLIALALRSRQFDI